jgi:glycosyltransferase involved in cell wall biosynthesis
VIRVLQALTAGGTGGTERMVASLVERLPAFGVQAEVSVLDAEGPVSQAIAAAGVPVHALGGARSYRAAFQALAALFRHGRFDIAHLYGFRMSLIARAVAVTGGPRLIHGIRGLHLGDWENASSTKTQLAVLVERAWSGAIAQYVTNSPGAVAFLTDRGLPARKFAVIPNGLDVAYWSPGSLTRDPAALIAVANFRAVKRLPLLIDAMAALRDSGRHFTMTLVGDGPLRPNLEHRVERLGLGGLVRLAGQLPRDEVRRLQQTARAAVITSAWEGMPVSVLEAMACGCPVVGTDVPGIRDLVTHERTGLLVPAEPEAIAAACARLLDAAPRAARRAAAARDVVVERYSLDRMAAEHASLYTMVATRA